MLCRTTRRILVALAFVAAPAALNAQNQADLGLDDVVANALTRSMTPGAVVTVVLRDSVAFMQAYGHTMPDDSAAVLPLNAMFRAGAVTEVVNALAALQLAAAGRLDLDAAIGPLVRELPTRFRAITMRQLLTHTAGLAATLAVPSRGGADDLAAAARALTPLDRLSEPGALYSHSTIGLSLVGLVLERAGRKPYADVIREHVLTPLGMNATSLLSARGVSLTPGWERSMSPDRPIAQAQAVTLPAAIIPVDGLVSTAGDLARLTAALLSDGVVEGEQRIPPGTVVQLMRAHAAIPGGSTSSALGMRIGSWQGYGAVTVAGTGSGHTLVLIMIPAARLGLMTLANAPGSVTGAVPPFMLGRMLPQREVTPATPAPRDTAVLAGLAAAAGRYANGSELLELVVRDGLPFLRSDDLLLELAPLPGGLVSATMHGREMLQFRFLRDAAGRPYLWIGQRALAREAPPRR